MRNFFVSLVLVLAPVAYAQTLESCDPSPDDFSGRQTVELIHKLLKNKSFVALEDELWRRMRRYEAGLYSDLSLLLLIEQAASGGAALEPLLQQWVAERPYQLMARLFKANYHIAAAYSKRGTNYADQTSREQHAAMNADFDKALPELKAALEIHPTSALTRAALMNISQASSGRETTLRWLLESERRDPANQAARWRAGQALDPSWGGRFEDLAMVDEHVVSSSLSPARQRALLWSTEMVRARYFHIVTRDNAKATEHYRKAAKLCASSEPLWQISSVAYDAENWTVVLEAVTDYLDIKPAERRAFSRRGWAAEKLGRMSEAIVDYEKAASLGDDWAQYKLGHLLITGKSVIKNIQRGVDFLEAAAAQGNKNAEKSLRSLRESRGQYLQF